MRTIRTYTIRQVLFFFCMCVAGGAFSQQTQPSQERRYDKKFPEAGVYTNSKMTYSVINAAGGTYGYDIFADDKLLIHQPSIPGVPGNKGFESKASSGRVAELVIEKIKKGEMPPTVTQEEMKKLKALNP